MILVELLDTLNQEAARTKPVDANFPFANAATELERFVDHADEADPDESKQNDSCDHALSSKDRETCKLTQILKIS